MVELLVELRRPDVWLGELAEGQRCGATVAHCYLLSDISENNNKLLFSVLTVGSKHDFEIFPTNTDQYLPIRLSSVLRCRE